jgi:peptidoglycan L-alanyl-D-glutamate endopeptidase CwlK
MPTFSKRSLDNLATCHPDLQKVAHEAIKTYDFIVICGHRNKADQDKAVREGKSKARWPTSKHNSTPSLAFDATPVPLDWNDIESFKRMGAHMKEAAKRVKVKIRWGGDFKGFFDGPHVELA